MEKGRGPSAERGSLEYQRRSLDEYRSVATEPSLSSRPRTSLERARDSIERRFSKDLSCPSSSYTLGILLVFVLLLIQR